MPRIYDIEGEPLDFCEDCFPSEEDAKEYYDSNEYDCAHPNYSDEDYTCFDCEKLLTDEDN